MNRNQIEELKSLLVHLTSQGYSITDGNYGVSGRIVGVGFRPYWSNPTDSKIDKIEINYIDGRGVLRPLILNYVVGYNIASFDGKDPRDSQKIDLDIHVYRPNTLNQKEPYEKVHLFLNKLSDN